MTAGLLWTIKKLQANMVSPICHQNKWYRKRLQTNLNNQIGKNRWHCQIWTVWLAKKIVCVYSFLSLELLEHVICIVISQHVMP